MGVLAALLAIAAAPPPLIDERDTSDPARHIRAEARLDTDQVKLSGEVGLTLTVQGPAPLTVTPPKPTLTRGDLWRVREDGPPTRKTTGTRETWTQAYRLSPLQTGQVQVPLGPVTVRPGSGAEVVLDWGDRKADFAVRVATSIESPSVDSLRPPADVEQLPPPPPVEGGRSPWWFLIVPGLLLISAVAVLLGRRRRPAATPRDAPWALGELADPALSADRCAWVLRQYLRFRFGLPAEARTTPELAATLRTDDRLGPAAADWEALLTECDAARFSGTTPASTGLADRARELVRAAEAVAAQPAR